MERREPGVPTDVRVRYGGAWWWWMVVTAGEAALAAEHGVGARYPTGADGNHSGGGHGGMRRELVVPADVGVRYGCAWRQRTAVTAEDGGYGWRSCFGNKAWRW
ncbi:hypothetical protein L1987_01276 [Smallanthus sonchifolius]|uniref:Uncharacterized protein n=1 Tax=Smallanthus sonchifolius TaxID=185202 RepID=A0ACB9K4K4_9ASTR|nr:hypothetical protein L1987_01276 [Smallanthus sonchifolius]